MFQLTIATPDKVICRDLAVQEVTLPGQLGELNILPGHSPLVTTLGSGVVSFKDGEGRVSAFAVSWGYCEVSGSNINILGESAQSKEDVDLVKLKSQKDEAEKAIQSGELDDVGFQLYFSKLQEIETQEILATRH